MEDEMKVGIVGYGNLGKGVELAIGQNPDIKLKAIFTRRKPNQLNSSTSIVSISQIEEYQDKIDVMILCGGSATDLPEQGEKIAKMFHTVDSFDTHANIPEYFMKMNEIAKQSRTLSLISTGWDPGLFSLSRLLGQCVLPKGEDYTFWGKGVSQGHSDAIRRLPGVKNGIQYTIPIESVIDRVRKGENPKLAPSEKHIRDCYVVAETGADLAKIEKSIQTMPNYFSEYQTNVYFISEEELKTKHAKMPHGGFVFRTGRTGKETKQRMEFSLALESNPEFTGSILVAFARAIGRLAREGQTGARTVFDIPIGYLSPKSSEEIRRTLL
jgi:diaminopimelate dehydrogenase